MSWNIQSDYYLYRSKFSVRILGNHAQSFALGTLDLPPGQAKEDEFFGTIRALYGLIETQIPLTRRPDTAQPLQLEVSWQGCAELIGICYPPEKATVQATIPPPESADNKQILVFTAFTPEKTAQPSVADSLPPPAEAVPASIAKPTVVSATDNTSHITATSEKTAIAIPIAVPAPKPNNLPLSEQDRIAQTIAGGNTFITLLSFLGFGLLLAFTPCVFPMIPILSGIIAGQKDMNSHKAFLLSLVYVLAMALTYTVIGVLAGLFGSNLQALFQNVWVLATFSGLFVLLALAMFGFYELQIPAALQTRLNNLSNRQDGGSFWGVAVMGILSALIVGPCVAAPLAGALIYIGQSGDALLGGMALFMLSLGMGVPLLIVGTSAGRFLPKAGAWMENIRAVFGVLLLAVAIWMLERVLPGAVTLALWAALLVISSVYLGAFLPLSALSSGWQKLCKGIGILLLMYGSLLLVGAAAGGNNPLQPLKGVFATASSQAHLSFRPVNSLAGLEQALVAARGQPVMLDFYADWCVSCKEMERYTFSDPDVQTALSRFTLLQADVTANNAEHKALMKQFGIFGPPAMLFFDANGQEQQALRLVGFMGAQPFAAHVQRMP